MEQAVLTRHELDECTELENRANLSGVNLTLLGHCNDSLDGCNCCLDRVLVGCRNLDFSLTVNLIDSDNGSGALLNALDSLSALTDDCTDKFFIHCHSHNAWYVRLVVLAWLRNCLVDDIENVQATLTCLVECLGKNLVRKSVALDIHLCSCDTVLCSGHLEVHIAKVILIAKDVAEHCMLHIALVGDKSHCNTCHRLLHLHTCIEQCQTACAHCCHRR